MVQAGLVLGGLEALLDGPAGSRDLHEPGERNGLRGVAEVEGQLGGLAAERRISSEISGRLVAARAQSYQRRPLAPFPQLTRCQAPPRPGCPPGGAPPG